jgi:uncharacterized protein (TIGR03435 family)
MRLLIVGIMACAGSLAMAAQSSSPPQDDLQFDVASIRRNASGERDASVRAAPNGQLTVRNSTLFNLVRNAYAVQRFQIVTAQRTPEWIDRHRWDIVAKAPEGQVSQQQMMAMLQRLLVDRFTLAVTRETREMPVYALVLGRADGQLGPQLRRSDGRCEAARLAAARGGGPAPQPRVEGCSKRSGPANISNRGVPLAEVARDLVLYAGRVVVDRSGLSGTFDFDLQWTPDRPGAPESSPATDAGSLFTAIQDQLGLKLEPSRAPVEVLVIEGAELPPND